MSEATTTTRRTTSGGGKIGQQPTQQPTGRLQSPVQRWEGTGKGSAHRTWRNACRHQAMVDSTAYHEAGNALCRAIRESSTWPWAVDKMFAVRKMRRLYGALANVREAEAQLLVKLGIEYNNTFTRQQQKIEAFDPNA